MRQREGLGFGACSLLVVFALTAAAVALEAELDHARGGAIQNSTDLPTGQKDNCNYTIIIETTCSKGAGTTDRVSLRFGDSSSNDILVRHLNTKHTKRVDGSTPAILDDVRRRPFQECATDAFTITGKCTHSKICYLYLKQRGDDGWRPGRAQILVSGAPEMSNSDSFYFRRFLPSRVWHGFDFCRAELTPFGIRQVRKEFPAKDGPKSP